MQAAGGVSREEGVMVGLVPGGGANWTSVTISQDSSSTTPATLATLSNGQNKPALIRTLLIIIICMFLSSGISINAI